MRLTALIVAALIGISVAVAQTPGTGGAPPASLLASGGTLSGLLEIAPGTVTYAGAGSLKGNTTLRSFSSTYNGTCSGACIANLLQVNGYNVTQTGASGMNTRVYTNLGGANFTGGFLNFDSTLFINSATGNTANKFYQAGNIGAFAAVNDGGGSGTEQGSLFGLGVYSVLRTGSTFWVQNIVQENDLSNWAGTSPLYAGGMSVVLLSDNVVPAARENFGFLVSAQAGAVPTIDVGIAFGGYQGVNPFASTAALMEWRKNGGGLTGGPTIARGVSLTGFTFTGCAFASTGYCVDGTGNGTFVTVITPPVTVASLPAAATVGAGARSFVTDATATLAAGLGNAVTGGGANKVPVYSDGTTWRIG